MKNTTTLSNDGNYTIELTHSATDPGMWIIRRWKKVLWFKKRISSDWFNSENQARAFADELQQTHNNGTRLADGKE